MKIQATLDHGAPPFAAGPLPVRMLLQVTGSAVSKKAAVPLNLALVLDRSGSMTGAPLHSAIEAAKLVARRMIPPRSVSSSTRTTASPYSTLGSAAAAADLPRKSVVSDSVFGPHGM